MRFLFAFIVCAGIGFQCPLFLIAASPNVPEPPKYIQGVTCIATSRQVPGYLDEKFLVSDEGLKLSEKGDSYVVERSTRVWNSNYGVIKGRNDESPIVEFQFSKAELVSEIVIWNSPAPRGFAAISIQTKAAEGGWHFLPGVFRLEPGSQEGDFVSQTIRLPEPRLAERIRIWCHGTHRGAYGQPDVASLVRVRFLSGDGTKATNESTSGDSLENRQFPLDAGVVNVREAPYFAKGDGVTDDTEALQQAMTDLQASRRYLYLPEGTYLVSQTLRYRPGFYHGDNNIRGAGTDKTIIRLKDATFTSQNEPTPVITFGFHGQPGGNVSADWFNNNIRDLTIDIGQNNPGAIGLQFYSNNAGAARNIRIRSGDGQGQIGLDLGYQDQNGPLLVDDLRVDGFKVGVAAGNSVNSQTLVNLKLINQSEAAVTNGGQCLTIERLLARGPSPRVVSKWGFLTLVDCLLDRSGASEEGNSAKLSAVESGEYLFVVGLSTNGFERAINSTYPNPTTVETSEVGEYFSGPIISKNAPIGPGIAFQAGITVESGIAVEQKTNLVRLGSPTVSSFDFSNWVNVRNFRQVEEVDDTAAMQRAMDSGAEVVYLPSVGTITISETVRIRPHVKAVVGFQSQVISLCGDNPTFEVEPGTEQILVIEDLIDVGTIKNVSERKLICRNIQGINAVLEGTGDVFVENIVGDIEVGERQQVFGRQVNSERLGTKLINRGGRLMIVGLKTERGGTLVETTNGGISEVLGGLCYTTNHGEMAPMIVDKDSKVLMAIGEVCYTGNPFKQIVLELESGKERKWDRPDVPKRFDFLQGSAVVFDGR